MRQPFVLVLIWSFLTACSPIPGLDDQVSEPEDVGPYPSLLTHEELTALNASSAATSTQDDDLQVRVDRMQARANALRNTQTEEDDPALLLDEVDGTE